MKPELKAKWVAALRSGEFAQGKGKLVDESGTRFCCLGVLERVSGTDIPTIYKYANRLTVAFAEGEVPYHERNHLANMNDTGTSFASIADYIEKAL